MSDIILTHPRERSWRRHELLSVAPSFWRSELASRPADAATPFLATWADNGWPVIVRRRLADDRADRVPVGVPLPPAAGKMRIALTVLEQAVLERSPPPSLLAVSDAADPAWVPTMRRLVALGARYCISPAAFGSLFWRYRTGLPYLSPRSDLDVLWPVGADCEIGALVAGIAAVERGAPMRIDGEIVFPDGAAVNWRELHIALNQDGPTEVLAKSIGGVRVLDVSRTPRTWRAA
jgi:phosphoribosyl-dephospho-CoA transferase